jgi:hypothetical protein
MADDKPKTKVGAGRASSEARRVTLQAMTGSADENRALVLFRQVASTLWAPEALSQEQRSKNIQAVAAALKDLAPGDELEGMLAAQMVATHNAAMDCLARAMIEGQSFEGRDQNLRHAAKLLGVYARQVEALDKHRGKGQQKITVEHVTVNEGGQAIVGGVTTGARAAAAADGTAPSADRQTLTHNPAPLAPQIDVASLAKPKQKIPARQVLGMVGDHPRNTMGMRESLRCGAKTRRGSPCRAPAVAGKKRCRMHGGAAAGSGAPVGNRNALKSGLYTREAIAERKALRELLREAKETLGRFERT